jgi:hypothetical protein
MQSRMDRPLVVGLLQTLCVSFCNLFQEESSAKYAASVATRHSRAAVELEVTVMHDAGRRRPLKCLVSSPLHLTPAQELADLITAPAL